MQRLGPPLRAVQIRERERRHGSSARAGGDRLAWEAVSCIRSQGERLRGRGQRCATRSAYSTKRAGRSGIARAPMGGRARSARRHAARAEYSARRRRNARQRRRRPPVEWHGRTVASTREGALILPSASAIDGSGRLRGIFLAKDSEEPDGNDDRPRSRATLSHLASGAAAARHGRGRRGGRVRRCWCSARPLLVRYGPEPDVAVAVAASASRLRPRAAQSAPDPAARARCPTACQEALRSVCSRTRLTRAPARCRPRCALRHVLGHPVLAEHVARDLDDDVVGLRAGVVVEARQPLQARRARRQDLDLARRSRRRAACPRPCASPLPCGSAPASRCPGASTASVPDSPQQRSFSATFVPISCVHDLERRVGLHRRVAGVVVHVAHALDAFELHALLHQVLVDVEQAAAREDLVELVLLQLVHARAARHDHGLDVEVVERVGDAVEQHAVVGGDLLALVVIAGRGLRIAAAQVARRQHASARRRGRASPAWRGRPARTAAPSRSPGNRTPRRIPRPTFAGSRMIGTIALSSMSSSARDVRFGRPPGIGLLMKWMTCARDRRLARRSTADGCVCAARRASALREPVARGAARGSRSRSSPSSVSLIVVGIGRVQEQHRRRGAGIEVALALARAGSCASRSTRRRSRCRPGTDSRTCGRRCSGRRRRRTRRSAGG